MDLRSLVQQLRLIFADPARAALQFSVERPRPALRFLFLRHGPLLALMVLFSIAAPLRWIFGGSLSIARDVVGPLVLAGGLLTLAMVFDKILENARGPRLHPERTPPRNLALFLHLPVSAAGAFFLFHFIPGYLMILVSGALAAWISIMETSRLREITPARAIAHYLSAALFLLLPLVGLLFMLNLMRTYSLFRYLYS